MRARDRAILLASVVVIPVVAILAAYWYLTIRVANSMLHDIELTRSAMDQSPLGCPISHEMLTKRWSKIGWSRSCAIEGKEDGLWEAWERGRLVIAGSHRCGQRHGEWTWFHNDGSIFRVIEYRNGEELSNTIVSGASSAGSAPKRPKDAANEPPNEDLRLLKDPQPLEAILLSEETGSYSAFTLTFEVLPNGLVGRCSITTVRNGTSRASRLDEAVCSSIRQRVYAPIDEKAEVTISYTPPHL